MTPIEIVELVIQLVTVVSLIVAIVAIRQNRRALNMGVFTHYTARFDEVMKDFPNEVFRERLAEGKLPESTPELRLAILRYLNLTSEEYYLYRSKYLDAAVWRIWEREVKRTLRTPMFRREWADLKQEFESYPEFVDYFNKAQIEE